MMHGCRPNQGVWLFLSSSESQKKSGVTFTPNTICASLWSRLISEPMVWVPLMSSRGPLAKGKCVINLASLVFSSEKFFLWYCVKTESTPGWHRSHRLFSFFFSPARTFCTARSSLPDKSNAAVFILCVCWGRWVLDKGPSRSSAA